jgi:hypothetical protein
MRKAGFVGGIVLGVVVIGGLAALALRPDSTSQKADSTPTPEATLAPLADQVMPVGAGTTLTPTPLPTRDEPGIDAKNISVRFVNGLDTDVCWLYIRQNGESQWGDDRLGSSTILSHPRRRLREPRTMVHSWDGAACRADRGDRGREHDGNAIAYAGRVAHPGRHDHPDVHQQDAGGSVLSVHLPQ